MISKAPLVYYEDERAALTIENPDDVAKIANLIINYNALAREKQDFLFQIC